MPRVVSNSVPIPACVTGNGGVRSRGQKPKSYLSHPGDSGKGKTGRMNENKPSMRRRAIRSLQEMTLGNHSGDVGLSPCAPLHSTWKGYGAIMSVSGTPRPRRIEGILASRISLLWNGESPMESDDGRCISRPDVRMAEHSSGTGRSEKRMLAAERQRESITGQIGHCPTRKGADVDRVTHPKNETRIT